MMKDPQLPERPEDTQKMPVLPEDQPDLALDRIAVDTPNDVEEGIPAEEKVPREVNAEPELVRGPVAETPEQVWAKSLEEFPLVPPAIRDVSTDRMDREETGLTVGDGFRFGCGFALAMAIGALAILIVVTIFFAVGTLVGVKPPF